eukprot:SAG25_NODE_809_length_5238_cov_5.448336_8_plen_60_part_00
MQALPARRPELGMLPLWVDYALQRGPWAERRCGGQLSASAIRAVVTRIPVLVQPYMQHK